MREGKNLRVVQLDAAGSPGDWRILLKSLMPRVVVVKYMLPSTYEYAHTHLVSLYAEQGFDYDKRGSDKCIRATQPKKKRQVYPCSWDCGKQFATVQSCSQHEAKCKRRPQGEAAMPASAPTTPGAKAKAKRPTDGVTDIPFAAPTRRGKKRTRTPPPAAPATAPAASTPSTPATRLAKKRKHDTRPAMRAATGASADTPTSAARVPTTQPIGTKRQRRPGSHDETPTSEPADPTRRQLNVLLHTDIVRNHWTRLLPTASPTYRMHHPRTRALCTPCRPTLHHRVRPQQRQYSEYPT